MKKTYLNFIQNIIQFFIIILLINCKSSNKSNLPFNYQVSNQTAISFAYNKKEQTLISAHRGGGFNNYPENCIESMHYLYEKGIRIFEIDLALTKDQHLILMHDNSLQRTSTGLQDVNQVNLSRIKTYELVDANKNITSFKIPTFEEALKWGNDKPIVFMIDFKKEVSYQKVINEIRKMKMANQVVLVSYTLKQAEKLHQLAPEMYLSVPMKNEMEFDMMMNSKIDKNKMVAFTGTRRSPKSLYDKIHRANIMVIFGTLGNIDKSAEVRGNKLYQQLENEGVDIFATDRPLEVFETLK